MSRLVFHDGVATLPYQLAEAVMRDRNSRARGSDQVWVLVAAVGVAMGTVMPLPAATARGLSYRWGRA